MRETGQNGIIFEGIPPVGLFDSEIFETFKTNLCYGIFLDPADEDYLTARYAWRSRLPNTFCWSAGQALEKYTKCALLINGKSAIFSHSFLRDLRNLQSICRQLIPDHIERPSKLELVEGMEDEFPEATLSAAERFEKNGSPRQRYRESGHSIQAYDLHKLDALCFYIRRVCVNLNENRDDGLTWKEHLEENPNTLIDFGKLHKKERRHFPEMEDALLTGNFQFFEDPPGSPLPLWYSWEAAAILHLPINDRNYLEALDWITKNSKVDRKKVHQFLLNIYNKKK